jgi:hypothetical protein
MGTKEQRWSHGKSRYRRNCECSSATHSTTFPSTSYLLSFQWSVENSVDNMSKNNVDIHNTNPCEELNYHGTLNGTSAERGANYGYPDCFAAWDPSIIPNNANIKVGTQFAIGTGSDSICANRISPKLCFPAHTAPLGVRFNSNSTAAYIGFHGSW